MTADDSTSGVKDETGWLSTGTELDSELENSSEELSELTTKLAVELPEVGDSELVVKDASEKSLED